MATSTDCDFLTRIYIDQDAIFRLYSNPDGMDNVFHLTARDEHEIYPAVDVTQSPALFQSGKVIAITGASRGIGRATAIQFAKAGAEGIAICARSEAALEETKKLILAVNQGVKVYVQKVDVTVAEDVRTFFENIVKEFGNVDVAVANAGADDIGLPILKTDPEKWWKEQETNYKSVYLVARYFGESLGEKTGTLVNVSSSLALCALPTQASYCCSKLAAVRLLESLHWEVPNLRVFSLHPGVVKTVMSAKYVSEETTNWKFVHEDLPGAVMLYLTTEKAEFLRGRYLTTSWNVEDLQAMKDDIVANNLLKTAFRPGLGC